MRRIVTFEHDEYVQIIKLITNLASEIEKLPESETKLTLMSFRIKLFSCFGLISENYHY